MYWIGINSSGDGRAFQYSPKTNSLPVLNICEPNLKLNDPSMGKIEDE